MPPTATTGSVSGVRTPRTTEADDEVCRDRDNPKRHDGGDQPADAAAPPRPNEALDKKRDRHVDRVGDERDESRPVMQIAADRRADGVAYDQG